MTKCIGCEAAYIILCYYFAWMFLQVVAALIIVRHLKRPHKSYIKWLQQVTGVGR